MLLDLASSFVAHLCNCGVKTPGNSSSFARLVLERHFHPVHSEGRSVRSSSIVQVVLGIQFLHRLNQQLCPISFNLSTYMTMSSFLTCRKKHLATVNDSSQTLCKVMSFCWEFLSFSMSRRNLASFTGNPPNSETMEPASKPTSSMNTRPKRSRESLQRPKRMLCDMLVPIEETRRGGSRKVASMDSGAGASVLVSFDSDSSITFWASTCDVTSIGLSLLLLLSYIQEQNVITSLPRPNKKKKPNIYSHRSSSDDDASSSFAHVFALSTSQVTLTIWRDDYGSSIDLLRGHWRLIVRYWLLLLLKRKLSLVRGPHTFDLTSHHLAQLTGVLLASSKKLELLRPSYKALGPCITWLKVGVAWEFLLSALRADKPSLVGSPSKTLEPAAASRGTPKRSSRLECGCNRCGWSANGRASLIAVSNGSIGGHPKHKVESDLCKNGCFLPLAEELLLPLFPAIGAWIKSG